MATHHVRHTPLRRPLDRIADLVSYLLTLWIEFWHGTAPRVHDTGATDRFADTLHDIDIDITAVHDQFGDTRLYERLTAATVISGDPELTDVIPTIDEGVLSGWLTGNPYDQNGGAL